MQVLVERLAGEDFDQVGEHVGGDRVVPGVAGRELERQLRELLDHLPQAAADRRSADADLAVRGVHVGAFHEAIGQPRLVREQVADRHRPVDRPGEEVRVVAALEDPQIAPFGDELPDRVVELEVPLLVELHQGDRGDRLGHRVDPEDRVGPHGLVPLAVHQPLRREPGRLAASGDEREAARDLLRLQVAAPQMIVDARQLRGAQADLFGAGEVEFGGR